jgi:succinyl-CoA synthetase alpha subunit
VTPGKGGQDVEGIPVFDTWQHAMDECQPNTAMIFVPPRFAADSIIEAAAAGVSLVVAITEGIPAHDELRVYNVLASEHPGTRLVGPNCPGILSPGKANVGIIPAAFKEGNVGVVLRSGTLTYQIGNEIAGRFTARSWGSAGTRCRAPRSWMCSSCSRPTSRRSSWSSPERSAARPRRRPPSTSRPT